MTRIEINDDRLSLQLEGIDRMLALRNRFDIPLDHVVNVAPGARVPGAPVLGTLATRIPAVVAPRTFYQQSGRAFFESPSPHRTLIIDLYNERYDRVVVEVENPHGVAAEIARAVRAA